MQSIYKAIKSKKTYSYLAGKHPGVNIKFAFDNSALNKKSLPVNQLYLVFVVFVVEFTLFHTFIIFHMFI